MPGEASVRVSVQGEEVVFLHAGTPLFLHGMWCSLPFFKCYYCYELCGGA